MAVPGVFAAVKRGGRVLVDGGLVNQLPYDLLGDDLDAVVAVDVGGERAPGKKGVPSTIEAILGASDIMQRALLNQRLKSGEPEVFVRPEICNVEMMDFAKADEVLRQSGEACDRMEARLRELGLVAAGPD
jgi:NTE family protein